jgi:hypothetical protein
MLAAAASCAVFLRGSPPHFPDLVMGPAARGKNYFAHSRSTPRRRASPADGNQLTELVAATEFDVAQPTCSRKKGMTTLASSRLHCYSVCLTCFGLTIEALANGSRS